MDSSKLVYLIDRTIGSKGQKLKKQNEYMYWSPFVSHHKPKLQINIITGKWHCWVSNAGGHNLFQLFKKLNATQEQFRELRGIVDETSYGYESKEVRKKGKTLCDGWVKEETFRQMLDRNCSGWTFRYDVSTLEKFKKMISEYDYTDGDKNRRLVHNMLSSKTMGDKFEEVFNGLK